MCSMSNNELDKEYVRKEVYDANMGRIEALMAASEARHERIAAEIRAENEKARGDIKALDAKIEGFADTFTVAINATNTRLDDLKDSISRTLSRQSWAIAMAGFILACVQLYIAFRK